MAKASIAFAMAIMVATVCHLRALAVVGVYVMIVPAGYM
jgi:hypothetical protein